MHDNDDDDYDDDGTNDDDIDDESYGSLRPLPSPPSQPWRVIAASGDQQADRVHNEGV